MLHCDTKGTMCSWVPLAAVSTNYYSKECTWQYCVFIQRLVRTLKLSLKKWLYHTKTICPTLHTDQMFPPHSATFRFYQHTSFIIKTCSCRKWKCEWVDTHLVSIYTTRTLKPKQLNEIQPSFILLFTLLFTEYPLCESRPDECRCFLLGIKIYVCDSYSITAESPHLS